jgi:uncharacterized repeat protein (TIGR01451 family)
MIDGYEICYHSLVMTLWYYSKLSHHTGRYSVLRGKLYKNNIRKILLIEIMLLLSMIVFVIPVSAGLASFSGSITSSSPTGNPGNGCPPDSQHESAGSFTVDTTGSYSITIDSLTFNGGGNGDDQILIFITSSPTDLLSWPSLGAIQSINGTIVTFPGPLTSGTLYYLHETDCGRIGGGLYNSVDYDFTVSGPGNITPSGSSSPDLTISKSSDDSNESIGAIITTEIWDWSLVISNIGTADAVFADGQTIFSDQLPTTNISYSMASIGSVTDVNSGDISCGIVTGLLTCKALGAPVTITAGTGTFTFNLPMTVTAAGTYTNPTRGNCGVDPGFVITESDEDNNTCISDSVTVSAPDLEATKMNDVSGATDLDDGSGGKWTWTTTLTNTSAGLAEFADGETIFTDNLPDTNISYSSVTVDSGGSTAMTNPNNVSCSIDGSFDLTCTASGDTVGFGGSTGSISLSFIATPTAATTYANPRVTDGCEIDPDGNVAEDDDTNNTCSDSVTVTAPNLTATKDDKAASGVASVNIPFTWVITVANSGDSDAIFNDTETILIDNLPNSDVTYGAVSVTNETDINGTGTISCSISSNDLTCKASSGTVIVDATIGTFDVEIVTTLTAAGAFDNPRGSGTCKVDPTPNVTESNEGDNVCADTVTGQEADLQATKSNDVSDATTLGNSWVWMTTVSNTDVGDAIFQSGDTIFTDDLPNTDISYGSASVSNQAGISGSGSISCSEASFTITCTASGGTVIISDSTGTFDVNITGTPTIIGTFDNPRSGGFCEVDIDNDAVESSNSNNSCSNSVTVTAPELTITKTNDVGGTVQLGKTFNWILTIDNGGNADAVFALDDVVVTDDMPATGSYAVPVISYSGSVIGTVSCTTPAPSMSCTADGALTIPVGDTITVTILVTAPSVTGDLINPESGVCEVDPDSAVNESDETNNACADAVGVNKPPASVEAAVTDGEITFADISIFDPAISKIGVLQPGQVGLVGEKLEWIITVTNNGNAVGNNIVIVDNIIPALQIDGVSGNVSSISTINGQTVTVTLPTLDPGQSVTYSIFTTVLVSDITVNNTACLSSDSGGDVCTTTQANTGLASVTQLPSTGETPNWRNLLMLVLALSGLLSLAGVRVILGRRIT